MSKVFDKNELVIGVSFNVVDEEICFSRRVNFFQCGEVTISSTNPELLYKCNSGEILQIDWDAENPNAYIMQGEIGGKCFISFK